MNAVKLVRQIISELYMKDRTIVCDDYDRSIDYLKRFLNLTVHEYPSGKSYWGWVIPDKYEVREAYIKDAATGKVLVDVKDHPMHLASYSAPFEGIVDFAELKKHLCWNEKVPEGIPSYYKLQYRPAEKNWIFCVTHEQFRRFKQNGRFKVKVDTVFKKGTMKVAEYFKKGESDDIILLVSHLDHPGQVNDGLSGVAVELALMQELSKRKTHYSYLFLVVQEFLGSVAYLNNCRRLKDFRMGIFSEMLSTGLRLQLQRSFNGDAYIDRIAELVFREGLGTFDSLKYLEGAGNDEIVFESPGIEVPFVSIMRARHKGELYRQYHTHLDNIGMLNDREIEESLNILSKLVDALENDYFVERKFKGFICLSNPEIGLYDFKSEKRMDKKTREGLHAFFFGGFRLLDGRHRVSDIASEYGLPFGITLELLKKMEEKGLASLFHREMR